MKKFIKITLVMLMMVTATYVLHASNENVTKAVEQIIKKTSVDDNIPVLFASNEDVTKAVEQTINETPEDDDTPKWVTIAGLVLAVLEVSFRLWPTTKDISLLSWIYRIISAVIPNKSSETKYDNTRGRVIRKIFKIKAD